MAQMKRKGLTLSGRLEKDMITFYTKRGKLIMRSSTSNQPLRRTREQFISRQRVAHNMGLWKRLKSSTRPMFTDCDNNYGRFCSLMRKRPVVFLTKGALHNGATLLLPGMPVSEGKLPDIGYRLCLAGNEPALQTELKVAVNWDSSPTGTDMVTALCKNGNNFRKGDVLRFYTLRQVIENNIPILYIDSEELRLENGRTPMRFKHAELRSVDGLMALTGSMFADTSTGWALVHIRGEKCSSQTVVTHCTLYEQYTTEEALMIAAESYGGLTEPPFLKPDTD